MRRGPGLRNVHGAPSWRLATRSVEAYVTAEGGHAGPVTFFRDTARPFSPMSVAPWAREGARRGRLPCIRRLRGDFFCLPFGGNARPWRGERHPVHGQTANGRWKGSGAERTRDGASLRLTLRTTVRPGRVDKVLRLVEGHAALYTRHEIRGMKGPMPMGHHAMLRFPDRPGSGRFTTGPFRFGQVFPGEFEDPERGGYSALKPGAVFESLSEAPTRDGGVTDLGRFPARRGFDDLAMLVGDPSAPLGWNAVVFPSLGVAWFALRNPRVLPHTVLWFSNGGRHYAPWNGRHLGVLGIEDVLGCFHLGLAESATRNPLSRAGHPTCARLRADRPFRVPYIMGAARVPRGFEAVAAIEPDGDRGVALCPPRGRPVRCPLDLSGLLEAGDG